MKKLLAAVVIGACAFTPLVAADDKQTDDQKVICKREKTTGSNLAAKRVCLTAAQWKDISDNTRREMRNLSDRAFNPTPIPGGRGGQ